MKRKYEIIKDKNSSIVLNGSKLYRIKALQNFNDVHEGDIGGYVESDKNLSHEGDCWIYDDSKAYDNATISDNAIVKNSSSVMDNAYVVSNSVIDGNSIISGNSKIFDNCKVSDKSTVSGNSILKSNVSIESSIIKDNVIIDGFFEIRYGVIIGGNVFIHGDGIIIGKDTVIETSSYYRDNLEINGNYIYIGPNSKINNINDIHIIKMSSIENKVNNLSGGYYSTITMRSVTINKNKHNQYQIVVNIADKEFFGNVYEFRDFIKNHNTLDDKIKRDYIEQINIFIDTIENSADIVIPEE